MTVPDESPDKSRKSFLEHLEDLRRTLVWSLGFLALGIAVSAPLAPRILALLKEPVRWAGRDPDLFLRVMGVTSGFSMTMKLVFWTGMVVALPGIVFSIGRFVYPGLTPRERRAVSVGMGLSTVLFAGGVVMGYYLTLPVGLNCLLAVNQWMGIACEFVEMSDYIAFALKLLAACGLGFELPAVVLVLGYLGVVSSLTLRRFRRHMIVVILVIATVLTPPDVMSQVLMSVPMIALYEICIWLVWLRERGRKKESKA